MNGDPSNAELERLFDAHDVPRRHLYPLWYRFNQWLGIRHRPPVTFSLLQHFLTGGPPIIVIVVVAASVEHWIYGTEPLRVVTLLLVLLPALPFMSWLKYRSIRRRIGLDP